MRILIIDDEPAVHDAYRRCFDAPGAADRGALSAMANELFGETPGDSAGCATPAFALTHVHQGGEGVDAISRAVEDDDRFAVAFIDVRMPPGIDGKETAKRIRALDPDINIVMVTGYSDFSPIEIVREAGPADKLFYIAKPFEVAEIVQTATALARRWELDHELAATRAALAEKVMLLEEQSAELAANESHAIHMATHDSLTEPSTISVRVIRACTISAPSRSTRSRSTARSSAAWGASARARRSFIRSFISAARWGSV